MKRILLRIVFFCGWLLSPFTFWNDVFINIPLSYLCARLAVKFVPLDFLPLVLIFYWLSNFAGLFFMYISSREAVRRGRGIIREVEIFLTTVAAYSLIIIVCYIFYEYILIK